VNNIEYEAGDNSGIIGAAIVGGFALVVANWYAGQWLVKWWKTKYRQGCDLVTTTD